VLGAAAILGFFAPETRPRGVAMTHQGRSAVPAAEP
jgi:hypothetical protein